MKSSLSNLVDNLAEEIHKNKCKDSDCFLEYESVKENLIKYKCLSCNKDYSNKLDLRTYLSFLIMVYIDFFFAKKRFLSL